MPFRIRSWILLSNLESAWIASSIFWHECTTVVWSLPNSAPISVVENSVISLAINNNRDLNAARSLHPDGNYEPNLDGSINIKIELKSANAIQKKKWKIIIDNSKSPDDPDHYKREPYGTPTNYFPSKNLDLSTKAITQLFQDMITENKTITTKQNTNGMVTTIIQEDTIGLEDFKSSIFTCTETKHSQTGKIYEMTFKDITK